ncbi:hypothetical protein B0H19DRAFT_1070946 [Mycena capillaripes]|nr:hypothetical protein B0H19DRAFT_1070946 [Mycena capillaripes]
MPRPTPTSRPLQEQFAPGGYLHEETSDTQVFGFSESQSRSRGRTSSPPYLDHKGFDEFDVSSRGYSQGDPANPYDSASPLYGTTRPPPEPLLSPPSKRQRREVSLKLEDLTDDPVSLAVKADPEPKTPTSLATKPEPESSANDRVLRFERLAEILRSRAYANGQDPTGFPLLNKFGGVRICGDILSPETIEPHTEVVTALTTQFYEACWHSEPPSLFTPTDNAFHNDPNALQREFLELFIQLTKHMPLLVHTVMDPDRRETMALVIESMGRIIDGMRMLVKVQEKAQREIAMEPLD